LLFIFILGMPLCVCSFCFAWVSYIGFPAGFTADANLCSSGSDGDWDDALEKGSKEVVSFNV